MTQPKPDSTSAPDNLFPAKWTLAEKIADTLFSEQWLGDVTRPFLVDRLYKILREPEASAAQPKASDPQRGGPLEGTPLHTALARKIRDDMPGMQFSQNQADNLALWLMHELPAIQTLAQPKASEILYCDVCGRELQRESCNHVRPCANCTQPKAVAPEPCEPCDGTGTKEYFSEQAWDYDTRRCHYCNGTGRATPPVETPLPADWNATETMQPITKSEVAATPEMEARVERIRKTDELIAAYIAAAISPDGLGVTRSLCANIRAMETVRAEHMAALLTTLDALREGK